jgi:uncharacterized integral membrane protein
MVTSIATATVAAQIYVKTTYFSIPLTLIALGLVLLGFMLILISLVLHQLRRIPERWNARY